MRLLDPLSRECVSYLGVTRFPENKTENKVEFFLDGKIELDTTRSILQFRLRYIGVLLPEGKEIRNGRIARFEERNKRRNGKNGRTRNPVQR